MDQLKNQRSTRLVEMVHPSQSSEAAQPCVGKIRQMSSSGGRHTDKPAGSRLLDGLQTIGVARCSRDGRHRNHQGIVPVDLQGSSQDGVLPFHGFQHGVLKQVPPLRRTVWGWRGVRVGEAANPGPVQNNEAPADWQNCRTHHRTMLKLMWQPPEVGARRRRPLPRSWDSDSDLDGPVQTQGRSCPVTQVDASSDEEALVSSIHGRRVIPRKRQSDRIRARVPHQGSNGGRA